MPCWGGLRHPISRRPSANDQKRTDRTAFTKKQSEEPLRWMYCYAYSRSLTTWQGSKARSSKHSHESFGYVGPVRRYSHETRNGDRDKKVESQGGLGEGKEIARRTPEAGVTGRAKYTHHLRSTCMWWPWSSATGSRKWRSDYIRKPGSGTSIRHVYNIASLKVWSRTHCFVS